MINSMRLQKVFNSIAMHFLVRLRFFVLRHLESSNKRMYKRMTWLFHKSWHFSNFFLQWILFTKRVWYLMLDFLTSQPAGFDLSQQRPWWNQKCTLDFENRISFNPKKESVNHCFTRNLNENLVICDLGFMAQRVWLVSLMILIKVNLGRL